MILLDANILVRLVNHDDPKHHAVARAVLGSSEKGSFVIVPQSLYELVAVATRAPSSNGLGMDTDRAIRWAARFSAMFDFRPDPHELLAVWMELVEQYKVKGFRVHDTRYVAAMKAMGATRIMTLNPKHFEAYGVEVIDPTAT